MKELHFMVALLVLLFIVISLRFLVPLYRLKKQDEDKCNWHVEEWLDAEHKRRSNYFED